MDNPCILVFNAGSSSIRFALYAFQPLLQVLLRGKLDRIGFTDASLNVCDSNDQQLYSQDIDSCDQSVAVSALLVYLEQQPAFFRVTAVGHRIVHGMAHTAPQRITKQLLSDLRRITPFDPEHMLREVHLIDAIQQQHPNMMQIACFDTAFHRSMPRVAKLLTIPRRYQAAGVERYGFHGISFEFLLEELKNLHDRAATSGRVILAHLGNGASLAAVRNGIGVDTSMGFTPTAGLMMSSRSGDLDPGLVYYLTQTQHMTALEFHRMVNHESGLLGVSEVSSDIRDLLACEQEDVRAAEAIALFCYQVKKWIGSFAAALGGVDTLVFAGGIGENAPIVRQRICSGLEFLGIEFDAERNRDNAALISTDTSDTVVRVIRTDEELMIARSVSRLLGISGKKDI